MSKGVLICNIRYGGREIKTGAGGGKKAGPGGYIRYIATRPGAARGYEGTPRTGDGHGGFIEYAAERPGSAGLFGSEDKPAPHWKEVAGELDRHDLPVWRIVVSLREDVAVNLGMVDRAAWEKAVRQGVQDAAKAMHLSADHLRWAAAYHQEAGHPHAHVVIWERPHKAARRDGMLERGEMKGVWRAFAREVFRDERGRLNTEKTAIRDLVRGMTAEETSRITGGLKKAELEAQALGGGRATLPPVMREAQAAELKRRLMDLSRIMPGRGRAALAYMPPEVRAGARDTAEWLLSQPRFRASADRHAEIAGELSGHYSQQPGVAKQAQQNARDDLRDRVAQVLLKTAAAFNRQVEQKLAEQSRLVRTTWQSVWRAVENERQRAEARAQLASLREMERAEAKARQRVR